MVEWQDHNLMWNESDYGGVADLRIPPKYLWTPDVLMYNRTSSTGEARLSISEYEGEEPGQLSGSVRVRSQVKCLVWRGEEPVKCLGGEGEEPSQVSGSVEGEEPGQVSGSVRGEEPGCLGVWRVRSQGRLWECEGEEPGQVSGSVRTNVGVVPSLPTSADEGFSSTYPTNVLVDSKGICTHIPPGIFLSTCRIDITWYPFDDQKCNMKFGSWTYDSAKVCFSSNF
ncbi:Neuronal acetylcholine receptor subunit alpha-7-like 4 [Homarus americanus]|uniref:Neuronal acetylcholine receptor subunit alpha-7-like 4 n=1 Tax=Homarus americanus TaxID=6706 RepID=A0A8J5JEM2_HOMAM|nr:Neuronal acetylcholine receptor subunit alpha-7-like 4 [Homarus americanus]